MPRSGGGLLAGLLASTGVAGRPEEYFWRNDVPAWRDRWRLSDHDDYVARVLEEGTTPNGVFGARIMWTYLGDAVTLLAGAPTRTPPHEVLKAVFPGLRFIYLSRVDRIAQAVSWAKAIQTNEWFRGDARKRRGKPRYDRDLIQHLEEELEQADIRWRRFFDSASAEPLSLTYERTAAEPELTARTVLSFLDVDPSVPLETRTRRQSDATNRVWIERYRREIAT
jgi:LPS sulfotransferase NodH